MANRTGTALTAFVLLLGTRGGGLRGSHLWPESGSESIAPFSSNLSHLREMATILAEIQPLIELEAQKWRAHSEQFSLRGMDGAAAFYAHLARVVLHRTIDLRLGESLEVLSDAKDNDGRSKFVSLESCSRCGSDALQVSEAYQRIKRYFYDQKTGRELDSGEVFRRLFWLAVPLVDFGQPRYARLRLMGLSDQIKLAVREGRLEAARVSHLFVSLLPPGGLASFHETDLKIPGEPNGGPLVHPYLHAGDDRELIGWLLEQDGRGPLQVVYETPSLLRRLTIFFGRARVVKSGGKVPRLTLYGDPFVSAPGHDDPALSLECTRGFSRYFTNQVQPVRSH